MQKNYKTFVKLIAGCAVLVMAIIYIFFRQDKSAYNFETFAGDLGYTTTIVVFLASVYNWLIWRIPCIGRWLHTPNLNGVWKGTGKSSYNDEEYTFEVKIKQSFLETHIHGYFDKSQSDSFSATFIHNDTIDRTNLVYSYQNDPKLEYRNKAEKGEEGGLNIHYGTTKLDIDYENLKQLSGTYWNDRNCTGSWILTKKDKKDGK